jgi:chromosome segregation ATPase
VQHKVDSVRLIEHIEREVKKANRELWASIHKMDEMAKMTHLQNRCTQLLTDLKRLQRDHKSTKTRADKLQKERDSAKSDLTKVTSIRDKLEKLSRETTTENRKLRVCLTC